MRCSPPFLVFVFLWLQQNAPFAMAQEVDVDANAIALALQASPEHCLRHEWLDSLEKQFGSSGGATPFWAAHLANGFLCRNESDLRQFLLLFGKRDFPTTFAQVMTVARAKQLAQEERALREALSGVRIVAPHNPRSCEIDVEGLEIDPAFEMRSLSGRYLHVRYRCKTEVERHTVFVPPGSAAFFLPPLPHAQLQPPAEKSFSETAFTRGAWRGNIPCVAGAALVFGGRRLGFTGVNNTEIPVFAKGSCSLEGWQIAAVLGAVESVFQTRNRMLARNSVFVGGSLERKLLAWGPEFFRQEFGVGGGVWAASTLLNPVHARWGASVPLGDLRVVFEGGYAFAVQNATKSLYWVSLSAGAAL